MHALTSAVGVERCVTSGGCLSGCHALEVKRMNGMRDVGLHHGQNLLLALKGAHSIKGIGDDSDVEVVARIMQVNNFNDGVRDCFEHFRFNPRSLNHMLASFP